MTSTAAGVWPPPPGSLQHQPHCFGCGEENLASMGVRLHQDGAEVVGTVALDRRHEGAPGIVHGGAVGALFDEVLGTVPLAAGRLVVTAELTVRFRAPALLGRPLQVRARETSLDGRKTRVSGELLDGGTTVATAEALFITVDPSHFADLAARASAPGA